LLPGPCDQPHFEAQISWGVNQAIPARVAEASQTSIARRFSDVVQASLTGRADTRRMCGGAIMTSFPLYQKARPRKSIVPHQRFRAGA
jgi:hypothetical protein